MGWVWRVTCAGIAALVLGMACDSPEPGDDEDAGPPMREDDAGPVTDAEGPMPDGDADVTLDASSPNDGATGVPTAEIPNTCGSTTTFCEQSTELGLRDGRGYGRGTALVDVDGDGWTDIWRSESGHLTDDHQQRSGLYRNMGDGTFEPWDVGIAEEHLEMNWAGIFGDIDGDGAPDLVLLNGGYEGERPLAVYKNDVERSGSFIDVTEEAGLSTEPAAWWSGAFGDYDGDGHLDLVVSARAHDPWFGEGDVHLYRNDGTGTFEEVSAQVGLSEVTGDTKNPIWIDFDRDGDLDLIISRLYPSVDTDEQTGLFENRGDEGFVRVDPSVFPGDEIASADYYAFAVAVADFDQDGWEDVYLGRWDRQDYVLRNRGDGSFEALGAEIGIDAPAELNTMGLGVGDMTANGYPDVFVGPGDPSTDTPPVAYCNVADELRFEHCEDDFQEAVPLSRWHGVAFGDLNRDFLVDVVINLGGFAHYDIENDEDTADWLTVFINHDDDDDDAVRVRLTPTDSPEPPVGAQLRLDAEETVYRTTHGAQGFQSINDRWKVLPMGDHDEAPIHVHWPSGRMETFDVAAGTEAALVEGTGAPLDEEHL